MRHQSSPRLSKKNRYLQIAFNSTLEDAQAIIAQLPASERILIEAGTPFIKRYGMRGISALRDAYTMRLAVAAISGTMDGAMRSKKQTGFFGALKEIAEANKRQQALTRGTFVSPFIPYLIADMKTMDRGRDEVAMAAEAGASAVIALGSAPIETLNAFVDECGLRGVDAMIDMMNVEYPLTVLSALKRPPQVVILHRGVDEERDNKSKMLPLHEIRRIKGSRDILISIAGGDTPREVQSAIFNDADIVVIWKSVYENTSDTLSMVNQFLKEVK